MTDLKGKVAVVTGASKGIGAAIAKSLGAAGTSVVVNYVSDVQGANRVVDEINANGGSAIAVQGSVTVADDVKRLFETTRETYGKLDILVNNAGVFDFAPLEAVTEAEFHRQFNTNVLGPILASQAALPLFGPEGGSIINVSSKISDLRMPNAVVYAATKGALDAATRILSQELGPRKIRVNTLAPGAVETEGAQRIIGVGSGSDFEKQVVSQTALGRIGQPDDIARVALFLASDESFWITGERIVAAGGFGG